MMSDFIIEDGVLRRYVGPGGDVVIPDGVTGIAAHAFLWCFCLKRVTIPASVREIRSWAFKGCASLSGVCLSEGLERIWPRAFEDCVSLREIWIPASVKKAWRPFAGCARLEAVRVAGDNPAYCDIDGVMYDRDLTRLIAFPWIKRRSHAFPASLRVVDRESFTCPKQTRIYYLCVARDMQITREMLEEWSGLFSMVQLPVNCERTVDLRPMNELLVGSEPWEYLLLVRPHVPPEAEGKNADTACPEGGTDMKNDRETLFNKLRGRFHGKKAAVSEAAKPDTPPANPQIDPFGVIEWKQAKLLKGRVVVPEGMSEIRDRLFMGNKDITSVVIPGTVKHIGELAFNGCENLEEVVLNEGVERIDSCAFRGTKLRALTYPDSVRETDGRAFCRVKLDAPVINASGTRLVCATENLTGEAYAVSEGTEVIGPRAFDGHKGLKALRLPDGLRRIEDGAFYDCGMTELTIPASVEYIGKSAFMSCGALEKVTLLNPRATVRSGAFSDCRALARIEWAGSRTTVQYCHLLGIPFMAAGGRLPAANLPHTGEKRFKRLTELCAEGRADPMEALAEWLETWCDRPEASEFYRRAANFWHFRAYARRQPQAVEWMEAWLAEHPSERLPSMLCEDIDMRMGLCAGSASGRMLNDLGFSFFDPEREYALRAIPGTGVVEASAYESEDGPDEDGFGREEYYDWWYLDDNLQPIPGVKMMHSYSNLDKRNAAKEFDALIAEASQIVHAGRQYSAELNKEEEAGFFDIPEFEYRRAVWDGWEAERPFPEEIRRLDPGGDFFEFYGRYDGGACVMKGDRRLELFPLAAMRAESLALEQPLVRLSEEWETWLTEEDIHRMLAEKLLILGRITPGRWDAIGRADCLGFVKRRFFYAPYQKLFPMLIHATYCLDRDDDDVFVLGASLEDATLRGLVRKLKERYS